MVSRGHLRTGVEAVRGAKLRSFWTMLGVIIGVASVISVVSIGEGVKQQISQQIHHGGKDVLIIRPGQLSTSAERSDVSTLLKGFNATAPLTNKDILNIRQTPGLRSVAPVTLANGSVKVEGKPYLDTFVVGTSADLPGLINQTVAQGSFIETSDDGQRIAVLGKDVAQEMFDQDVPLGRTFTFNNEEFIVKGIFNTFTGAPVGQTADYNKGIFIPYQTAQELTNNTGATFEVLARPSDPKNIATLRDRLQRNLDKAHGGVSGFSVLTADEAANSENTILDLLTKLIAGVAAISLFVGGVGIMNVMLVSVAERTHEIGIRKAIGATNRQIMTQFMIESTVLTVVGGIIGIIVALLVGVSLRATTSLKPVVSWEIVLIATVVSLLVGIIFGTVPAVKAARKDPIDALRAE